MRKFVKLGVVLAVAVGALAFVPASPAMAYATNGCKFNSTGELKWQDATRSSGYATAAQLAASVWTATPTPIVLHKTTSGANIRIADGNFGNTPFDGYALDTSKQDPVAFACVGGHWTTTIVTWWNTSYTDGYSQNEREDIMVHYIGYALGLGYTTYGSCATMGIMQVDTHTRYDVCGLLTPQTDDIAGINALY